MSVSREIGVFPRYSYSAFNCNFLTYCACPAHNWVLSATKKKKKTLRIAGCFTSISFLKYNTL